MFLLPIKILISHLEEYLAIYLLGLSRDYLQVLLLFRRVEKVKLFSRPVVDHMGVVVFLSPYNKLRGSFEILSDPFGMVLVESVGKSSRI